MKSSFFWKILICVMPSLLALGVDGSAFYRYLHGQGGFKLGVDLVGGAILIFEVDLDKFPDSQLPRDWKPQELADNLKRRIDPADLYNITIRMVSSTRVEIILPTGGKHQVQAEEAIWQALLQEVKEKWPPHSYTAGPGRKVELFAQIVAQYPDENLQKIRDFIDENYKETEADGARHINVDAWKQLLTRAAEQWPLREYAVGRGKVGELGLQVHQQDPNVSDEEIKNVIDPPDKSQKYRKQHQTTEEIQHVKELISQVGNLEFRIVANEAHDSKALEAAQKYFKPLQKAEKDGAKELEARQQVESELRERALGGKPPPPPRTAEGQEKFDTDLGTYSYTWVELSRNYRSDHGLSNPRDKKGRLLDDKVIERLLKGESVKDSDGNELRLEPRWMTAARARERGVPYMLEGGGGLLYSRPAISLKLSEKDRDKKYEYFLLTRDAEDLEKKVSGVESAQQGNDGSVHFRLKPSAGGLFYDFTRKNKGQLMAIDLDGQIMSVATIQEAIRTEGRITGTFTPEQMDRYVTVFRAGALQGSLKQDAVSESTMGPTLGEDTIRAGAISIVIAFAAILGFMVIYYRFAGIVACVALLSNLLLTVAFMVLVNATFTLPGLAGLVLMLGMAVDANILIYERLREERDRGASLALAIRNGYDRAFPTIIDTHLSSIFTAIVLYVVGNDQLKGFGISLTVGLIISLFTSLYVTRVMFDFWLSRNWLHKLSMLRLFSRPNIDFMGIRYYWFTATIILTIVGAAFFFYRLDRGGLNIDFVGGTAYGGELVKATDIQELRQSLSKCDLPDLSVEQIFISSPDFSEGTKSKLFTVRTSEKDADRVQVEINRHLGELLKRIKLESYQIAPDNKSITMEFHDPASNGLAFASRSKVSMLLAREFKKQGMETVAEQFVLNGMGPEKDGRFPLMELSLLRAEDRNKLEAVLKATQAEFAARPQPERLENFDSQLATETQNRALVAILASWGAILLYLWFRFGNWTFGLAAVLCLIHDLFFTLGIIAFSHYIHGTWFGDILGLRDFKIDLPAVAALLTLVGYSVNDTIVVFDRIKEVRGKNPELTSQMINDSVNQTLSRTLLASLATWLVVFVLYVMGGEGIHLFAFVMVVGVIVGTYSSIYIASPLLLIFGEGARPGSVREPRPQPVATE